MTITRQALGKLGEDAACRYIERLGWRVLDRNWRTREGEIDIVALDGSTLVLLEVRTRSGTAFGTAAESITSSKAQKMTACAYAYLATLPAPPRDWRIDVVALQVSHGRVTHLDHFRHALA
jgi:putative endonuclease